MQASPFSPKDKQYFSSQLTSPATSIGRKEPGYKKLSFKTLPSIETNVAKSPNLKFNFARRKSIYRKQEAKKNEINRMIRTENEVNERINSV